MRYVYPFSSLIMVLGLISASCGPREARTNGEGATRVAQWEPTRHWIYDDQLQAAMRDIDHARLVAGDAAGGDAADPSEEFLIASRSAEQLAESANALIDSADRFNLGADDRKTFLELSRTMHDQALSAGRAARDRRTIDLRRHLDAVQATCISCHTRFRDFAAELAPPRV